jgi:hypothetical protein
MNMNEVLNTLYVGTVIVVAFSKNSSEVYRYKCNFPVEIDDKVVVPSLHGVSIAHVRNIGNETFIEDLDIEIKHAISRVDFAEYERLIKEDHDITQKVLSARRANIRAGLLKQLESGEMEVLLNVDR